MATYAAIKSEMGSTPYYNVTMKARDLLTIARPARETDDWAGMGIEDRLQRDVNKKRVRDQLVPYYANHPDRFNGSFIVLIRKGNLAFESLEQFCKIAAAYTDPAEKMGFLTVAGDDLELIVLDGQHRYWAIRDIQQSDDDLGPFATDVLNDEMSVIFIEHDEDNPQKTRRIFNKINRYAKPTSRADNIITSEDDGFAIIARWLLNPEYNGALKTETRKTVLDKDENAPNLVNWTSNTLTKGSPQLTTLSTVYHAVEDILTSAGFKNFGEKADPVAPDDERLKDAFDIANTFWSRMLTEMDGLKQAVEDPDDVSDHRYDGSHPHSLLLRPVGQMALVKGITMARDRSRSGDNDEPTLDLGDALKRANQIDWSADADPWQEVLVRPGGRMIAGKNAIALAGELIAYFIASEHMTDTEIQKLRERWNEVRGKDMELDGLAEDDVDEDQVDAIPENLPDPIQ